MTSECRREPTDLTAYPVVGSDRWRLMFEIASEAGKEVDLRAFLRLGEDALSETWISTDYEDENRLAVLGVCCAEP